MINVLVAPPDEQPIDVLDLSKVRQLAGQEKCDDLIVHPGEFILAASLEQLSLDKNIGALVSPLSHISRLGIGFLGSFYIRPGFSVEGPTPVVFEFCNHGCLTLRLHPGMPLCHILFFEVSKAELAPGDIEGHTDTRSGFLFSRYDLNALYREIIQQCSLGENKQKAAWRDDTTI
jgi:dCTP deaminase